MKKISNKSFFWISLLAVIIGLGLLPILGQTNFMIYVLGGLAAVGVGGMIFFGTSFFMDPVLKEISKTEPKLTRKENLFFNGIFALILIAGCYLFWDGGILLFILALAFLYKIIISFYIKVR